MNDYVTEGHIAAIKREVEEGRLEKTSTVGIEMLNIENFKFKLKNKKGIVSIAEMIGIREFIDGIIRNSSHITRNIIRYDKKSPHYWGKLEKCDEYDDYAVSINLEDFMHEDSEGKELATDYFLPDNYALADKVLKAYEEAGGDIKNINSDEHYRECTNWKFKSKAKAKKLVAFIDKTYVIPKLKEWKEFSRIKKINWLEERLEFVFKKK
jgi:hypothetical protein